MIFISACLKYSKEKTRIGSAFIDYLNILFGVPEGSILGPILFIIFLSDLFYIYNDFDSTSYTDDTTPYVCRQNYVEAIQFSEPTINSIFAWFKNKKLIANSGKNYFLVSPYEKLSLKILDSTIESSPCDELLGITIDNELTFHKHIISLCSKPNQKLSALARIVKYLTIDKPKILIISFMTAQFNYYLTWMYHSRTLNNKINRIQEKASRIVYHGYKSNFKELLERVHSFTIHERNMQYLAIEAYKIKNGLSPVILNDAF